MKYLLYIYSFLFLTVLQANSFSNEELLNKVLVHLKKTQFEKALFEVQTSKLNSSEADKSLIQELEWLVNFSSQVGILGVEEKVAFYTKKEYETASLNALSFFNNGLYLFYYTKENDQLAMSEFQNALQIAEQSSLPALQKEILKAILEYHARYFSIYNNLYQKSLEKLTKITEDDIDVQVATYYSFFFERRRLNQIFESEQSLSDYRVILDSEIPDFYKGNICKHLAIHKEYKQEFKAADSLYNLSIDYYPKTHYGKFKEKLLAANISYAVLKYKSKAYTESIDLLDNVYPRNLKGKLIDWNLAYLTYWKSKSFYEIKEVDSAYVYISRSFLLQMDFSQEKHIQEVADLQIKYRTVEKEKQILKEQQRAISIRNWLIAAGIALVLGTSIAILLQKNTTKKRKLAEQEALLEQQKVETLLKEQELVSIDAMIAGQEKERTKVANELHDDLGSLMATVKLHFDNIKVNQKDPALKNAQKLLDEAYQKIREMAHAKNSGVMANQGLLPAVKKMADTISQTNVIDLTIEDFGMGERIENSLELTVFRIIQELIANIIKHSGANKANIQFTQHEDNLNIIVEDNGKGFDMTTIKRTQNGMGLGTIEKRIEHLEGTFTVDSIIGKGTSILIDIPV